jgi:hypothetical protein
VITVTLHISVRALRPLMAATVPSGCSSCAAPNPGGCARASCTAGCTPTRRGRDCPNTIHA